MVSNISLLLQGLKEMGNFPIFCRKHRGSERSLATRPKLALITIQTIAVYNPPRSPLWLKRYRIQCRLYGHSLAPVLAGTSCLQLCLEMDNGPLQLCKALGSQQVNLSKCPFSWSGNSFGFFSNMTIFLLQNYSKSQLYSALPRPFAFPSLDFISSA